MKKHLDQIDLDLTDEYQRSGGTPTIYLKAIYRMLMFYLKIRLGILGGGANPVDPKRLPRSVGMRRS